MKRNAKIVSTGFYVPEKILPNSYFNDLLGEDVDTWLVDNLTIRERRWCAEKESTADLVEEASKRTIQNAGISASDLDLIIVATDTPEYISPSTASVTQYRLGAKDAGSFDLNSACAGFVTALDVGAKYIRSDENYNNVLVVGAYAMSKYLDMNDKKTVTLFADGAGAVLLSSTNGNTGFLGSKLYTEGQYHDWMGIYAGGTNSVYNQEILNNKDHLLKFVKKFPNEINPATWTSMISELATKLKYQISDIDKIFFTQININSIRETLDNLSLDMNKTYTIMDRYAYTGSACIPMALADAVEQGKLRKDDLVFFMGSGGGLAFATAAFKWG